MYIVWMLKGFLNLRSNIQCFIYKNFPDTWLFISPQIRGNEHPFWQGIKIWFLTLNDLGH